jgi:hypothetical protein
MKLLLASGLIGAVILLLTELVLRQFSMSIPMDFEGSVTALLISGVTYITLNVVEYFVIDRKSDKAAKSEKFARKLIGLD